MNHNSLIMNQKGVHTLKITNYELRKEIQEAGIYHWQIADQLGMSEATLSRKFRYELKEEEKKAVYAAIEEVKKGVEN